LIAHRRCRTMEKTGVAVQAAQPVITRREAHANERHSRDCCQQEEAAQRDSATDRRQPQPYAEPGGGKKKSDCGSQRRKRRPKPLPEAAPSRPAERALQDIACIRQARRIGYVAGLGHTTSPKIFPKLAHIVTQNNANKKNIAQRPAKFRPIYRQARSAIAHSAGKVVAERMV